MGLLQLFGFKNKAEVETYATAEQYMPAFLYSPWMFNDGVAISEEQAYGLATYSRCMEMIVEAINNCPISIKQETDKGSIKAKAHSLHSLFRGYCNLDMPWHVVQGHLVRSTIHYGTGYAYLDKDASGNVVAIWPLKTCDVKIAKVKGNLAYFVKTDESGIWLRPDQVLHIRGRGNDGYLGKGLLSTNGTMLKEGKAANEFSEKFLSQGMNAGGFFEQSNPLTPDAQAKFLMAIRERHTGSSNAFGVGILPMGMKYVPNKVSAVDAQLEQRKKQWDMDAARLFGIPYSLIADNPGDHNSEQQWLSFMKLTLLGWFTRLEVELEAKLLSEDEKANHRIKYNADALERADLMTRYQAHNLMITGGWGTRNEARELENRTLEDGLDAFILPLNMGTEGKPTEDAEASKFGRPPANQIPADAIENVNFPPTLPPLPPTGGDPSPGTAAAAATETVEAFLPVLRAIVAKLITKEANAIKQALGRNLGEGLQTWASLWYADHAQLVAESLKPLLESLSALKVKHPSAEALAKIYIDEQLTRIVLSVGLIDDWRSAQIHAITELLKAAIQGENK